ncbi:serine/threonine-protein phosphatase 7 long form-like protein [Gossypium australe]|uniref:Serine/threonine-protein phosphatase 7 long form-like protein n=1 Tax=Gossypium australe TaxID=47621 RepID=A0A5B6ULB2_9ROSI|nr:serine/threonine-protein phosphatase 7 long form-like protein [Gossypium australe]
MGPYCVLRGRVNSVGFLPDERLMSYLELAGFGSAALIRTFDLRYDLISVLVKRWRPETHAFHLSCGDCTITLEDVALQLGLHIDGNAVTGVSSISMPAALCYDLLGRLPILPMNGRRYRRAYIIHLIGGVLMLDANDSTVHLMYLPLLSNLHNTRSYSWGSAVLAMLYRELCRTTDPSAMDIGGCLILLQCGHFTGYHSWHPLVTNHMYFHSTNPSIEKPYTVSIYHLMIENHVGEGFGCIQYILTLPVRLGEIHGINRWGKHGNDWGEVHEEYITMWNNRLGKVPQMGRALDLQPSLEYIQWY